MIFNVFRSIIYIYYSKLAHLIIVLIRIKSVTYTDHRSPSHHRSCDNGFLLSAEVLARINLLETDENIKYWNWCVPFLGIRVLIRKDE